MSKYDVIKVKNLNKKIKQHDIIKNVSFEVRKGEIFGLIGQNGAGKTTIMRMLVGLSNITEGEVKIFDYDIQTNKKNALKFVGAIIETPKMYQYMSGYQNLKIFSSLHKIKSTKRIKEVVEIVGLSKSINTKVSKYSLGMRQRLGIAQALLHEPKVLILDEPTNGLDPTGIKELRYFLRNIAAEKNISIIISSHLINEIELTCDRIGIIKHGELVSVVSNKFEDDKKIIFNLKVAEPDTANKILNELGVHIIEIRDNHLRFLCYQREIPSIIKRLVNKDLNIYYVNQEVSQIEDKYMQIINTKELD